MDEIFLRLIRLKAEGFCCAQMLVTLALEAQAKTNPDLVRAMAGLCFGITDSSEVCGALSGGACLISLYTAKGTPEEEPDDRCAVMIEELVEWFREAAAVEYGGIRCGEILDRFPDRGICGQIVADTYNKCMEILISHGFNPSVAGNG